MAPAKINETQNIPITGNGKNLLTYIKEEVVDNPDNEPHKELANNLESPTISNCDSLLCSKCGKTWSYYTTGENRQCPDCRARLLYQCFKCKKLYKGRKPFETHLTFMCSRESWGQYSDNDNQNNIHGKGYTQGMLKNPQHRCDRCGKSYLHRGHMLQHKRHCMLLPSGDTSASETGLEVSPEPLVRAQTAYRLRGASTCPTNSQLYESNIEEEAVTVPEPSRHRVKCAHCGYYNYNKRVLISHIQSYHPGIYPKKHYTVYECPCGKIYKYRTSWDRHSRLCRQNFI